jgi:hypothetical protein
MGGGFLARSQNCQKQLLASCLCLPPCLPACLPACPPACPPAHLSVRTHETTRLPRDRFREIWWLSIFLKSVEKIQVSFKSDKNNGRFT